MKKVFLSIIVIAALVIAGIGGAFASYVDTEMEMGDTLQAGSIDLEVKLDGGQFGFNNDPDLEAFSKVELSPDATSFHAIKLVRNVGTLPGHLYIHFMNLTSEEDDDKAWQGGYHHPEPEYVAEMGGQVGTKIVPGFGVSSDYEPYVEVALKFDGKDVDLTAYDTNPKDGMVTLDELDCHQIYLGLVPSCGITEVPVEFRFHFVNRTDGTYYDSAGDEVYNPEWKFIHWPTNLYMGDKVKFDIMYELWNGPLPDNDHDVGDDIDPNDEIPVVD